MDSLALIARWHIKASGQIQGVGFRPYVYRLATHFGLTGCVYNDASGVTIEVQGKHLDLFLKALKNHSLPLAKIDSIHQKSLPLILDEKKFEIKKSHSGLVATKISPKISPDVSICDACLSELFDKNSHYYLYPFINCTNCGPRYTITEALPYDRQTTSMKKFKLCETCSATYHNPADRRYHAQPLACVDCGPRLSYSIDYIANAIRSLKIVALKGLGGYQLIADAKNKKTIQTLRQRKNRPDKPFALMALNVMSLKNFSCGSLEEEKIIVSQARPIVVLPKKEGILPKVIAPHLASFGVMLPSTPLHYLLFHALENYPKQTHWFKDVSETVLLVTSGNASGSGLIFDDAAAQKKLASIADLVVNYNRDIVSLADDSVVKLINQKPFFIRRARGYVPDPIPLPYEIPSTLALGGHLKNTICLTRGKEAFISPHIGDLNNRSVVQSYHEVLSHMLKIIAIKPERIACDFHPDFYSTQIANTFNVPVFPVQHHHAHLAASAVENQVTDEAIGLALDGFGLGENNENWGGELIHYHAKRFKRLGFLKPLRQPGGEIASKAPWRMADSVLYALGKLRSSPLMPLLEKSIHSPLTSSCGRLFDAASALLGVCQKCTYEGQSAMMLESLVTHPAVMKSGWVMESNQLNLLPLFERLIHCDPVNGANLFHGTLAAALAEWTIKAAFKHHLSQIVLGGGCFINKILSEQLIAQFKAGGLTPLYPTRVPINDGGISLGQAWVAGNIIEEDNGCA